MKSTHMVTAILLIILGMIPSACDTHAGNVDEVIEEGPAKVEHLGGAQPTRVTLTEDAAKRLDIQTAPAKENTIPYAAVLYDTEGNTWVYINPEHLVFVRSLVTVDHIENGQAFLSKGLPDGSLVVTTGAEELYGSETEFEEE